MLHVIAISQAGIAAPTLTVKQDFEAKKIVPCVFFPDPASTLHYLPFHAFALQTRIEPRCNGLKPSALTTTLRGLQRFADKMYLNQSYGYEKGNGSFTTNVPFAKSLRLII